MLPLFLGNARSWAARRRRGNKAPAAAPGSGRQAPSGFTPDRGCMGLCGVLELSALLLMGGRSVRSAPDGPVTPATVSQSFV